MKALTISDTENMIMAIQDEIRRNDASRYDHRLHGVLLVAQGVTGQIKTSHLRALQNQPV